MTQQFLVELLEKNLEWVHIHEIMQKLKEVIIWEKKLLISHENNSMISPQASLPLDNKKNTHQPAKPQMPHQITQEHEKYYLSWGILKARKDT